ncbi:hypothetical protein KO498_03405 [Lentibacter algarum]|uniref:hypothetical protein n=1 Tax=Lentibacter algarum TaxID=576131 RepID=UPI001C0764B1|nr:hypothetical protein [Lentibacter algarum]MBU2980853.1 hypothetical protein [Lentibacter algarum]
MKLTTRAAQHLAKLKALGFDVLATDDFAEIEELVQQTGKPFRSPMFDTRRNDFTEGRAFWLFLKLDGEIVGGLAAQLIGLGQESFEHYIARSTNAQYGIEADLEHVARPLNDRLRGDLIYLGDLHISDAARGKRQVLREYVRLCVILSAMTWPSFDWVFAHIPYQHRSLQDVYGFASITHGAFTWGASAPFLRTNDMAVIYHAKADLLHSLLIDDPDEAAKNKRKG